MTGAATTTTTSSLNWQQLKAFVSVCRDTAEIQQVFISNVEGQCDVCVDESGSGSSQTDPLLLAVFYDYIQLMPMVAEANQMSQELNKV